MKAFSIFLLSLLSISSIFSGPRIRTPINPMPVFIPMPLATLPSNNGGTDAQRDQEIFSHFLTMLASFGKILLNPEDLNQAKHNATQMIDSIVNIATTIMKRSNSVRTKMAILKFLDAISQLDIQ